MLKREALDPLCCAHGVLLTQSASVLGLDGFWALSRTIIKLYTSLAAAPRLRTPGSKFLTTVIQSDLHD